MDRVGDSENTSASFLSEAMRLKLQEDHLEKSCCMTLRNMKCLDPQIVQPIATFYKDREHTR